MQNTDEIDLSIVIPAYKESGKIRGDIDAASAFLTSHNLRGEIIVVDDGSPDDTARVAQEVAKDNAAVRVIRYDQNGGKGKALRTGILEASGRVIMFADAGMCVPYEIAVIGLSMIELDMCDIAHGSRRMRGSVRRAQPAYRRIGSQVYRVIVHVFMGIPGYISDTQCGFKLYRRAIAKELYSDVITRGFMFDIEVIMRALRAGHRILEFPVMWSNDADTRFEPVRGTIRNLRELVEIRLRLLGKKR